MKNRAVNVRPYMKLSLRIAVAIALVAGSAGLVACEKALLR
jgi:hypothetical protein